MKTVFVLAILLLLAGCARHSALVVVGPDRTPTPNMISDYSFYSHEFVRFFDSLPTQDRRGVLSVSEVTENSLRFTFPRMTKSDSESAIAELFDGFAQSNYRVRYERWEREKHDILKPFIDLADNEPEIFKRRAIEMIEMPLRPSVEVYILRIE